MPSFLTTLILLFSPMLILLSTSNQVVARYSLAGPEPALTSSLPVYEPKMFRNYPSFHRPLLPPHFIPALPYPSKPTMPRIPSMPIGPTVPSTPGTISTPSVPPPPGGFKSEDVSGRNGFKSEDTSDGDDFKSDETSDGNGFKSANSNGSKSENTSDRNGFKSEKTTGKHGVYQGDDAVPDVPRP